MSFEIPAGELVNLRIKKLSLVTSPASRCVWIIKKSNGGGTMEELLEIYNNIFNEEITQEEISKAEFSAASAKEVLTILGKYVEDVPDELVSAWKKLSKLLIGFAEAGYKYPEKSQVDEFVSGIEKSKKDPWPSMGMAGQSLSEFVQKVEYLLKDDLSSLQITKDGIKTLGQKTGIESSRGGSKSDPNDRWPSLGPC